MQLLYWSPLLKPIFMEVTAKWPWFCKSVCYTWFLVQTEPIVSTFSKAKQTWAVCQNRQVACYPQCDSAIQIFPFHDTQYSLWSGQGKRSKLILHWLRKVSKCESPGRRQKLTLGESRKEKIASLGLEEKKKEGKGLGFPRQAKLYGNIARKLSVLRGRKAGFTTLTRP